MSYGDSRSRLARVVLGHDLAAAPNGDTDTGDAVRTDPLVDLAHCLDQGSSSRCQIHLPCRIGVQLSGTAMTHRPPAPGL